MDSEKEHSLVERAKTNPEAFAAIYDSYYPKITNYILHRVGDVHATQDITSIVFFKAWHSLPTFKWKGVPFSAWLYRIASNEVNTFFRQKRYRPASLDALFEETQFELPSDENIEQEHIAYQDALAIHEDFLLMSRLVQQLPMKYQEILALRFFEKKPLKDISDITGKNLNTVKSLLSRGTLKLRQSFIAHKNVQEG
jgi:RNA polymerase sigma-70 factor (ECF subfamily)